MKNGIQAIIDRVSLKKLIFCAFLFILLFVTVTVYVQLSGFIGQVSRARAEGITQRVLQIIGDQMDHYLQGPEYVNALNIELAQSGKFDLSNPDELGRIFLREVLTSEQADYIYFANEQGGIVSSGETDDGYTISHTPRMQAGAFLINAADKNGTILSLSKRIEAFDPRSRAWYSEAKVKKTSHWSGVYGGVSEPTLGITASAPLTDAAGNIIGVFGADILLNKLSEFLARVAVTPRSEIYLLEESGLVIASSDETLPLFSDTLERMKSSDATGVLKESWDVLSENSRLYPGFSSSLGEYRIGGESRYLSLSRYTYKDNANINWIILIVMPQKDLITDQDALYQRLVMMLAIALALSMLVGAGIVRIILRPIRMLKDSVQEICSGSWGREIRVQRKDELGELASAFNVMSETIRSTCDTLVQRNKELRYLNAHLEDVVHQRTEDLRKLSITDDLTGLYNHRYIIDFLLKKTEEAARYQYPLSIALFDLDYFKRINDSYGHLKGNEVLIKLAKCLTENVRHTDVVGRYGGEEFLVILPYTPLEEAYAIAERIRRKTEELLWFEEYPAVKITISGGVAIFQTDTDTAEKLIARADERLYRAKEAGRNRIEK